MTEIGLATPTSGTATNMDEAYKARYTLPGTQLDRLARSGARCACRGMSSCRRAQRACVGRTPTAERPVRKVITPHLPGVHARAQVLDVIGNFPVIIRPAFTLGGTGGRHRLQHGRVQGDHGPGAGRLRDQAGAPTSWALCWPCR